MSVGPGLMQLTRTPVSIVMAPPARRVYTMLHILENEYGPNQVSPSCRRTHSRAASKSVIARNGFSCSPKNA